MVISATENFWMIYTGLLRQDLMRHRLMLHMLHIIQY